MKSRILKTFAVLNIMFGSWGFSSVEMFMKETLSLIGVLKPPHGATTMMMSVETRYTKMLSRPRCL